MTNEKSGKSRKVICLANSCIHVGGGNVRSMGLSGGDVRFIEIFKRLTQLDKLIITSQVGRRICENNSLKASFIITTREVQDSNIVLTYLFRIVKALSLKIEIGDKDIIYSASDFLTDTFPAFIWKLRNRKANWIICAFLIVPTFFRDYSRGYSKVNSFSLPSFKRILYFFSQRLTIFLGKRRADQILVLNKMDKEYLVKNLGIEGSKVNVVEGGVDYNHLRTLRGENTEAYDGIFLGRFHPQKGIFDLIKIWRLVCNKKPEARLCVIGSGPQSFVRRVKELVKENNMSKNVDLIGARTDDEKFLFLKSAYVFLCPSYYESFAIVIAEAMACGLPVVAYDLPIYSDIYDGYISKVPLGDINKFAGTIINFLDDGKLRKSFGLEGQRFVQRYDWDKISEKEYQIITRKGSTRLQ